MITPKFFDAIHYGKAPLESFAENYFFLQGISDRIGFRRYTVLTNQNRLQTLKLLPQGRTQVRDLLKTILKIISYITLILPALMLVVKGVFRLQHSFKVAQALPDAKKAQLFLDDLRKGYNRSGYDHSESLFVRLESIEREKKLLNTVGCSITPGNNPMGDLLHVFEKDPEVLIEPKVYHLGKEGDIQSLMEVLKAAFATGRRLVGIQFEHPTLPHALAGAVSNDGRFRIIDSLCDISVDMDKLTRQFNAASIPDSEGQPLQFKGEFVSTHLQKDANACIRFATLYLYQILKKRDVDAFEEVNGAFAEGKLQRYEDYAVIGSSRRLRDASAIPKASYEPFILSWIHRSKGFSIDRWQDVTLQDIVSSKEKHPVKISTKSKDFGVTSLDSLNWSICIIGKETFTIKYEHHEGQLPLFVRDASGLEKNIAPETSWSLQMRLGELVPGQQGMHAVILHDPFADSQPIVLKLQPGETLFARLSSGVKQIT